MFNNDFNDLTKMMEMPEPSKGSNENIHRVRPDYIYGKDMHDHVTNSIYNDWCRWYFPQGIKEKIKDNELYLIWYNFKDASDPMDSSCSYHVWYIERAPKEIQEAIETNEKLTKIIIKYQNKYKTN